MSSSQIKDFQGDYDFESVCIDFIFDFITIGLFNFTCSTFEFC